LRVGGDDKVKFWNGSGPGFGFGFGLRRLPLTY